MCSYFCVEKLYMTSGGEIKEKRLKEKIINLYFFPHYNFQLPLNKEIKYESPIYRHSFHIIEEQDASNA